MSQAFKELLAKVEATGSSCLTDSEKIAIAEIFRRGAMGDRYMRELADKIQRAHLTHCLDLPADGPDHDNV